MLVRELKGIYVIWLRELIKFWREKIRILTSLVQPAVWLFIMGKGIGSSFAASLTVDYVQFMFPGVIGMTVLFTSIFSAVSIIWDRQFGFLKEVMVAPVSRTSIVIGKALSGSTTAMIQGTMILLFAPLVKVHVTLVILLQSMFVMFLISFTLSSAGILVAARMESFHSFQLLMNFIVMPMFFLSGAIFPISRLPLWMRSLAVINPLRYGVDALKGVIIQLNENSIMLDLSVIMVLALVLVSLAVYVFKKEG